MVLKNARISSQISVSPVKSRNRPQNTDKRDGKSNKLLLCSSKVEYICSVYPLGEIFSILRAFTHWTSLQRSQMKPFDDIFQFLLYFLGLTPILLWFVLGLISKMIRRREENEIKRRFSIDGRKFGFSLFSALKRLCILYYIIWPLSYCLWYGTFFRVFYVNYLQK